MRGDYAGEYSVIPELFLGCSDGLVDSIQDLEPGEPGSILGLDKFGVYGHRHQLLIATFYEGGPQVGIPSLLGTQFIRHLPPYCLTAMRRLF